MIEKLKQTQLYQYLEKNYTNVIIVLLLLIINIFSWNYFRKNIPGAFVKKYGIIILLIIVTFEILLTIGVNYFMKKKKTLEKIFLLLIIPIGLSYLVLIPLGKIPDEQTHAKRIYDITEGNFITKIHKEKKNQSGAYLYKDIKKIFSQKKYHTYKNVFQSKSGKEKVFLRFPSASLYSFVCYLPQATGVLIGKIINLPLVFQMYLGRLMNFLVWMMLMYFSIKYIPYKKITVFAIGFIPIVIQEAVSLSADAITIGTSIFLVSYILYLKEKKSMMEKKDYIICSLTTIVLSLCKIVYLPICLVLFLIPYDKFKSKKDKYVKIGLLALFVIILNLIFLKISSSYLAESNLQGNPSAQLSFLLHNPFSYLQNCFNAIYQYSFNWLYELFGMSLCLFDVILSPFYMIFIIGTYIYIFLFDNTKKITKQNKLAISLIVLITIALIFTSLFIQWTPVHSTRVEGIQGRYFLPILFLITILCNSDRIQLKKGINTKIVCYLLIFINIYALTSIFFGHL